MVNCKPYGGFVGIAKFKVFNGLKYRIETKIRNDKINNCVGAVFMLNPGSSTECEKIDEDWSKCSIDPTMRAIIDCVLAGNSTMKGFIQIFNLFNLCNSNKYKAIEAYGKLKKFNEFIESDADLSNLPWVWLSWGCYLSKELEDKAKIIYKQIKNQKNTLIITLKNKDRDENSVFFYHPRYVRIRKFQEFVEIMKS